MNTTMNMTLEQLIQATELCGAGAPGSCSECPLNDPSGDFECIEYLNVFLQRTDMRARSSQRKHGIAGWRGS